MLKALFTVVLLSLFSSIVWAKEVRITVNGMVCSFCAQGINKKLSARDAVKSLDVNLGNHLVKVELKESKELDDKTITQILTDAGYSVSKVERQ